MNLVPWKEKLQEKPLFGCFVTFPSPALTELTAALGFDFTLLDNEHGNIDQSTLEDMVRASQCQQIPSIVRVTTNSYDHIQKALDMGANGVQVPMVNTAEDAENVVKLTNFPPVGNRGTAYLTRAATYGIIPDKQEYLAIANSCKFSAVHIETSQAVENLDAILEVRDIDMLFIGPGDLASSMGLPPGHQNVQQVTKECIGKIRAKGKVAGTFTGNIEYTQQVIEWGATYIVTAINSHIISGIKGYLNGVR